jgi:murein DD-endopeptidase MepM/ murein hydrolase activator NlpD
MGAVALVALVALVILAANGTLEYAWWWATHAEPPAVQATAPDGVVRGTIEVAFTVRPGDRAALDAATLDGTALQPVDGTLRVDTAALRDGPHTLHLAAQDRSRRRNRAALDVRFTSDNTPPKIAVNAAATRIRAGQVTALTLVPDEAAEVAATWGDAPLALLPGTGGDAGQAGQAGQAQRLLALVAAPVTTPSGARAIHATGRDPAGNVGQSDVAIEIEAPVLPRQALEVPPSLAQLATGPVATAEAAQVEALTSPVRSERLWTGAFSAPLPASFQRTTGFGDRRDYADGYVAYHAGYDIAAPLGLPIPVAAGGIVAFAGRMQQRGNAVVVDHGWGVYTLYGHLSRIDVQVGQRLAQGDVVGLVGTTGLSTGPHLHWEVRLRGQAVDPAPWVALSGTLG